MIWTGKSTAKYKKLTSLSGRPCSIINPSVGDMSSRNRISGLNQPGNTGHTVYISLELEISVLAVQSIHQRKIVFFSRNCLVKMTLRLF